MNYCKSCALFKLLLQLLLKPNKLFQMHCAMKLLIHLLLAKYGALRVNSHKNKLTVAA